MIYSHSKIGSAVRLFVIGIIWLACSASSCTTALRNEQLESVAKDWALVIRASQVIPVYPLSEDLQPGDILLVSTPIEDQVALYKAKGFLPLDQHLVRLYAPDFKDFYNSRYGLTDSVIPPAKWQTPTSGNPHSWDLAPRAAFPTYQFSVATGSGLNLAIPIHGVPFALGLMNSGKASGAVTISDAFTFGLDNARLTKLVKAWALVPENRSLLGQYAPNGAASHFLRVVSRVYVTGRVSVTVNNDEATSGQVSGGADKPIELLGLAKGETDKNYTDVIGALDKLAEKLPGGKIKIATASTRSVTLSETFERPLVIGYVGFDMPILEGGRLGAPISTLAQLTERPSIPAHSADNPYRIASLAHMYKALKEIQGPEADHIRGNLDKLVSLLPEQYSFSLYEMGSALQRSSTIVTGGKVPRETFSDILDYLGYATKTTATLDRYLSKTRGNVEDTRQLEHDFRAARNVLTDISSQLSRQPALMQATDFVFFGL